MLLRCQRHLARPARFERATAWFVARYSIQLSYGRVVEAAYYRDPDSVSQGLAVNLAAAPRRDTGAAETAARARSTSAVATRPLHKKRPVLAQPARETTSGSGVIY